MSYDRAGDFFDLIHRLLNEVITTGLCFTESEIIRNYIQTNIQTNIQTMMKEEPVAEYKSIGNNNKLYHTSFTVQR